MDTPHARSAADVARALPVAPLRPLAAPAPAGATHRPHA